MICVGAWCNKEYSSYDQHKFSPPVKPISLYMVSGMHPIDTSPYPLVVRPLQDWGKQRNYWLTLTLNQPDTLSKIKTFYKKILVWD